MWNPFKKSKEKQIEENESEFTKEELENMRAKADEEAVKIYTKIYSLFKEHINELKEGDNFILLHENNIKLCDNKELNYMIIYDSIYRNSKKLRERIPELDITFGKEIRAGKVFLGFEEYYIYTINIKHDNIIEIYDVKFRVKSFQPLRTKINNGNEICVTVLGIDKNIYKII